MTFTTFDFHAFLDASKKAFAPVVKFNELALQGFERAAREQYAFAGEMLDYSLKQMQVATVAKDFNELTARQVELATQFAEKANQRSQDFLKLTTDHQAQITKLFDEAVTEATKPARKAA